MSDFGFEREYDRSGSGSLKWDLHPGELAMWVADMDFMCAPAIRSTISDIAARGIYGYALEPDEWTGAYMSWWERRHGFSFSRKDICFSTGVIPVLSSAVRAFTRTNEQVLVMSPVYNIFFNSIENNGRRALESCLKYENGQFAADMDDIERKLADPATSLMFLCNPQNPSGNIWSRDELGHIARVARDNSVIVLSDEIHCDITSPGSEYVPFLDCGEDAAAIGIAAISPTKAFNIAGIGTAACVSLNHDLKWRIERQLNTDECGEGNVFAYEAAIAAFNEGETWLDGMREYVSSNKEHFKKEMEARHKDIHIIESDATYLSWVDISALLNDDMPSAKEFCEKLRRDEKLFVSQGGVYRGCGDHFLRINMAAPRSRVDDAINRLQSFIRSMS